MLIKKLMAQPVTDSCFLPLIAYFPTDFQIVVQFLLPFLLCLYHCGKGGLYEAP